MTTATHLEALPASPHLETTVLGAMLTDPAAVADALAALEPSDFSVDSHRSIFRAMLALHTDGQHIDYRTVCERLEQRRELDSVGGLPYIIHLEDGIPRNFNVESYCLTIKEKARLRSAITVLYNAYETAGEHSGDVQGFLDRIGADLSDIAEDHSGLDIPSVGEWLHTQGEPEAIFESMADVHGIHTGFAQLDELTGGFQPGELIIVAARPSMGKTAWMVNASAHLTLHEGRRAAVFSLEQKKKIIFRRLLASLARIDARDIRRGNLRAHERTLLLERREMLMAAPLHIDDIPGSTCSRIRAKCSRMHRRSGLDIVLVDQLSKIPTTDCRERDMRLKIGEQTGMLKRLAQDLGVPVVLFCQIRRADGKGDVVPRLSDLKESGSIEEDADVVVLLHRPEYYDKTDEALKGVGQMILAKNREGETKTLECQYNGRILRWEDTAAPAATQNSFDDRTPW